MDCIFCKIIEGKIPSKTIFEDDIVKVIMDINPICDGHLLVIPKKHFTDVYEVDNDTLIHMLEVAKKLNLQMMEKLNKEGGTISVNYGNMQEIKHLHVHIMTNFKEKATLDIDTVFEKLRG